MIDPNNRPGGDTLILTAKSANKIQWFDGRDARAHSPISTCRLRPTR